MNGSPIIQDGKLVGAVTHVFANEPTMEYGLYIVWMLMQNEDAREGSIPSRAFCAEALLH